MKKQIKLNGSILDSEAQELLSNQSGGMFFLKVWFLGLSLFMQVE
jgi:hypothetical protein